MSGYMVHHSRRKPVHAGNVNDDWENPDTVTGPQGAEPPVDEIAGAHPLSRSQHTDTTT